MADDAMTPDEIKVGDFVKVSGDPAGPMWGCVIELFSYDGDDGKPVPA